MTNAVTVKNSTMNRAPMNPPLRKPKVKRRTPPITIAAMMPKGRRLGGMRWRIGATSSVPAGSGCMSRKAGRQMITVPAAMTPKASIVRGNPWCETS